MAISLICILMWLPIEIDSSGVYLLVQHIGIYTLWLFGLVLLINTLSIILGSDYGYIISFATQILQIAVLYWPDDKTFNQGNQCYFQKIDFLFIYIHCNDFGYYRNCIDTVDSKRSI